MQFHQSMNIEQAKTTIVSTSPDPSFKHGESPTAIILAVTILVTSLMSSIANLVQVTIRAMRKDSKLSR
jgi:hypothetical protein